MGAPSHLLLLPKRKDDIPIFVSVRVCVCEHVHYHNRSSTSDVKYIISISI